MAAVLSFRAKVASRIAVTLVWVAAVIVVHSMIVAYSISCEPPAAR